MVSRIEHKNRTGCPVACALDIIGDHWTLLIVRNLMFLGVHEYKDMLLTEEHISTSILTDRLKKLERDGLISSIPHPSSKRRKLYYLTESGKDLVDVMISLVLWSNKHLKERLKIPREKQALLNKGHEPFKKIILQELKSWEKNNGLN